MPGGATGRGDAGPQPPWRRLGTGSALLLLLAAGCAAPVGNSCWPVWQAAWDDPGAWNATAAPGWTRLPLDGNLDGPHGDRLRVLHGRWEVGDATLLIQAATRGTATVRWPADGADPSERIRSTLAAVTPAQPDFEHVPPPKPAGNGTLLTWHGPLRGNLTFSSAGLGFPPAWRPDRSEHNADQSTGAYVAEGAGATLWLAPARAAHASGVQADALDRVVAPLRQERSPGPEAAAQRARGWAAEAGLDPPAQVDVLEGSHCT